MKYTTNMENQWFSRKPGISISMAGATFLDENINKNVKSELLNVVYGCLDVNFANAGHGNGPSRHTYTDRGHFKERRIFHVCLLLPMQADGKRLWTWRTTEKTTLFLPPQLVVYKNNYIVLVYIHTWTNAVSKRVDFFMYVSFCRCRPRKWPFPRPAWANIHTYIHTFISSIAFLRHLKTNISCMFAHACRVI